MRATAADAAPPHAPELGTLARLLGRFHVTGVFWYRLHRFGVRALPEPAVALFVFLFSLGFSVVLRRIRAAVAGNLEAVLGPAGWLERQRRIFRTLHTFAWCLTERYEWLSTEHRFVVERQGGERWETLSAGGGVVLVTAHVGSWEIGSAAPQHHGGPRVHVVREEELDPRAQAFLGGLLAERTGPGYRTHFAVGDPLLGMALLDALRRGEAVAVQGDRPRRGGRTVEASLFGRPFAVPAGPAALARSAGVPLLPVFVLREGRRRYRAVVETPIEVAATADRSADLAAAAQSFTAALERIVRQQPHQWFCFRKLWR